MRIAYRSGAQRTNRGSDVQRIQDGGAGGWNRLRRGRLRRRHLCGRAPGWPSPKGGRVLWRHLFHGEEHKPGSVESAALAEIDGIPAGSVAAPVPGASMPMSRHLPGGGMRVVLGWIEAITGGARMSLAIID